MCLIKFLLGIGLFILVFVLVSAFGLVRGMKRMATRQKADDDCARHGESQPHKRANGNGSGKIIDESEGEYVEFEEIKDDGKS